MIASSLTALSFASPWMLAGLAALPVIWWLLRLTPPRPETVKFPPTFLLLALATIDKAPVRSPWWLTLLRMLVAAALIIALAGPQMKPPSGAVALSKTPLLVVADNGWAAASRWALRQAVAEQLAAQAEDAGQPLYLAATAGPASQLRPLSPAEFRQQFASLSPQSYPGDRAALAQQIAKELGAQRGKLRASWLADGVEDAGADTLRKALADLAGDANFEVYMDAPGTGALALLRPEAGGGPIRGRVLKAEPTARSGTVAAVTARGDRLATASFEIPAASASAEVSFDLPLELRNQVARLEIISEGSAGAVYLLDNSSHRRRVGLIASEEAESAQPLLSPSHYLQRALSPFADIIVARTANLDMATDELVRQSPSVIILSDVGKLTGAPRERLQNFVEKGGMLMRFAGPRLEQGGDGLLPAPLREGGRSLGGAMTWTSPQKLAPFEGGSPFETLSQPGDVTISQQVLTDPAAMGRGVSVWARLADGTPLVTAAKRGKGQVVFFHITANPDWSNLPMSGLFVEMMRKILEAAPLQLGDGEQAAAASETDAVSRSPQDAFLQPWRLLNGFGKLAEPGERAQAIAASQIQEARPTPQNPPGLYGPQNALRTINVMGRNEQLMPLKIPGNARLNAFAETKTIVLTPWFFLAALALFLLDGLASALVLGHRSSPAAKAAAAMLALALVSGVCNQDALAEPARNAPAGDTTAFAVQASLETRFAYVLTGDAEADRVSQAGLAGLSKVLAARTAVEPGAPIGVDPTRDELVFFPLIYWPVSARAEPLPDKVLAKIDAYMKQGGLIIFDTKNDETLAGSIALASGNSPLSKLLGKLDLPPLQRVPEDHVLTKAFYLLQSFPGRWDNGDLWVEARPEASGDAGRRGVKADGVSSIIITSNDLAAAWALDEGDRPMFPVVPGGEEQREISFRAGVNIVMYALTGNYKADQVHVPAILERLGH